MAPVARGGQTVDAFALGRSVRPACVLDAPLARDLSAPLGGYFCERSTILIEPGILTSEGLPSQHGNIDVRGIDLDRETGATGHFGCDNGRARPAERIIDGLARRRVVLDRPPHALHGFLRSVTVPVIITGRNGPHGRLLAIPAPMCARCSTDGIPTGFVLPMVVASAKCEAILGPDDLSAHAEPCASRDCLTSLVCKLACQM